MKVIDILFALDTDDFVFANYSTGETEHINKYHDKVLDVVNKYQNKTLVQIAPVGNALEIRYI